MNLKRTLSLLLAALMCITLFTACKENEQETDEITTTAATESESESGSENKAERFDYFGTDLTPYVSVDRTLYNNTTVELSYDYKVDEDVLRTHLESYINSARTQKKFRTQLNDGAKITDSAVKLGDSAFIYYKGFLDGVAFEGGSNWDDEAPYELVIGSGSFIPGFEEGLIGLIPANTSKDEPFALNVTFPESYQATDLAGKQVVFEICIEYIIEYNIPAYDETFITDALGFVAETNDVKNEFEAYTTEMIKLQLDSNAKNEVLNVLWDNVLAQAKILVYPEEEIEHYYNSYLQQYEFAYQQYVTYKSYYDSYLGYNADTLDEFVWASLGLAEGTDWKAETREMCKIDVAQNLVFHQIAKQENLVITDADYQESIQYYVDLYTSRGASQGVSYTAKEIEEGLGSAFFKEHALFAKVNKLLADNCTVTYAD